MSDHLQHGTDSGHMRSGRHIEPLRVCDEAAVGHRIPSDLKATVALAAARFWQRRGQRDPGGDNDWSRGIARREEREALAEAAALDTTPNTTP